MDTAAPSGKFCRPMPMARAAAPARLADLIPAFTAPNPTPTARPSGMLCKVIASTRRMLRDQFVLMPSASSRLNSIWRWGRSLSTSLRKKPPARKPTRGGNHFTSPMDSESSIDGASNDQKLAAIMTPAAKPSMASRTPFRMLLKKNTIADPRAVRPQVKSVATSAWATGDMDSSQRSIGCIPLTMYERYTLYRKNFH